MQIILEEFENFVYFAAFLETIIVNFALQKTVHTPNSSRNK